MPNAMRCRTVHRRRAPVTTGRHERRWSRVCTGISTSLTTYFVKDGNQMAKEPSVTSFGTLEVADHDPHQVGYVLGVELLHNVGAMELNGPGTDIEPGGCLLARGAAHDLSKNYSLARGQ